MNRRCIVVLAVVMSLLVVAAQPAVASDGPVVVSQHTTDTDLDGADTLDNMTVVGSGDSASVQLALGNTQNFSTYTEEDPNNVFTVDSDTQVSWSDYDRHEGAVYTTVDPVTGDATMEFSVNVTSFDDSEFPILETAILAEDGSTSPGETVGTSIGTLSGEFVIAVRGESGRTKVVEPEIGTQYFLTLDLNDATGNVTLEVYNDSARTDLFGDATTSYNNTTTYDHLHALQGRDNSSTGAAMDGNLQNLVLTTVGPSENGTYVSANHTVEQSEQAWFNITENTNATVNLTAEAWDGSSWTQLAQQTGITSTGNKTLSWSASSHDTVRTLVAVENDTNNGDPAFTLDDESVGTNASDPAVNNSSATPTGDLSTSTPTLKIDINDTDFDLAQGDSVEVEFFVDDESIGTDTLTSNGTASQDITNTLTGGDHTWNVTAADDYGHSVDSQDFTISVPANLTIRNETSPHNSITGCAANVTFYESVDDNPTIVERDDGDGDGNISLSGLPVDSEFVAVITCDGYHTRTILINSLFDQQSAFLINTTESTIENRFTVEDRTGDFPAEETELIIEKAINRSEYDSSADGFEWTSVAGDELGADESFVTDLIEEDRYRIKVQNDAGDQRILGAYTADTTGTINLVVGRIILDPEATDQPAYTAERTNESGQPVRVTFEYNDSVENTTKIWLHIYEFNNESNELLANTSFTPSSGNYGTFSNTEDVPSAENDTTWVVDFHAVRDGEDDITAEIVVGDEHDVLPDIPEWLLSIIYVGTLLIVAGLFSQLNADVGALVVAGLGGLFLISGFMPGVIGSGVVLLSMMVAGLLFIQGRRGGGF